MKKRFLSLLLSLCILLSAFSVMPAGIFAFAAETVINKDIMVGDSAYWKFEDETLTIYGAGRMDDFYSGDFPWKSFKTSIKNVVVESGITRIAANSFNGFTELKNVSIANTVIEIDGNCFVNCKKLKTVVLPNSLKTIEGRLFYGCSALEDVVIPDSVTSIGTSAFSSCESLKSINLPSSLETIKNYAFSSSGLESVVVPENVTTILNDAFLNCSSLENVSLPSNISALGQEAFYNTPVYENGNDNGIIYVSNYVVNSENVIGDIVIRAGTTGIAEASFYDNSNITSVSIPSSVKSIDSRAFNSCSSLKDLSLQNGLKRIGSSAFENTAIESLVIPETVETIEFYAFRSCENLNEITLPDGITHLGREAFSGTAYCSNEDNWENDTLYINKVLVKFTIVGATHCAVKEGTVCIAGYAFLNSDVVGVTVPSSVKSINENAFTNCYKLSAITLSDGLTTIGDEAFSRCKSLSEITIPNSVQNIGESVFYNCSKLKNVALPSNITIIPSGMFSYCDELNDIVLPDSVKIIGASAFAESSLKNGINFPNGLEKIGAGAFAHCETNVDVVVPESVLLIEDEAFYASKITGLSIGKNTDVGQFIVWQCEMLEKIEVDKENPYFTSIDGVLYNKDVTKLLTYPYSKKEYIVPDTVVEIEEGAFDSNEVIEKVVFNDNLEYISDEAFYDCVSLKYVELPSKLKEIGEKAFKNCYSLESIIIPDTVKKLGEEAFRDCFALKGISIGSGLAEISKYAFYNCYSLEMVTIPSTVETVSENAFSSCDSLYSIRIEKGVRVLNYCFTDCNSLEYVYIPNTVEELNHAFWSDKKLKKVVFESSVEQVDFIRSVYRTFSGCEQLTEFDLGNIPTRLDSTFTDCKSLKSVDIGNNVAEIGDESFSGCERLETVTLSKNVNNIHQNAFYGCEMLKSFTVDNENETYKDIDGVLFSKDESILILYPASKDLTEYNIPDSCEEIKNKAFSYSRNLVSVSMNDNVKEIGISAFSYSKNLKNIKLSNSINEISSYCFYECCNLTNIVAPNDLIRIGEGVFKNTGFANDLENWKDGLLYLNDVYLISSNSYVAEEIEIKPETKVIADGAFAGNNSIKKITIPEGIKELGSSLFYNCNSLKEVILPKTIEYIGVNCFGNNYKIERIYYPKSKESFKKIQGYTNVLFDYYFSKAIQYGIQVCDVHTWNDGKYSYEPNCYSGGEIVYTCVVCDADKSESIPNLKHNYVVKQAEIKPTCVTDGMAQIEECTYCSSKKGGEIIKASSQYHNIVDGVCKYCKKTLGYDDMNLKQNQVTSFEHTSDNYVVFQKYTFNITTGDNAFYKFFSSNSGNYILRIYDAENEKLIHFQITNEGIALLNSNTTYNVELEIGTDIDFYWSEWDDESNAITASGSKWHASDYDKKLKYIIIKPVETAKFVIYTDSYVDFMKLYDNKGNVIKEAKHFYSWSEDNEAEYGMDYVLEKGKNYYVVTSNYSSHTVYFETFLHDHKLAVDNRVEATCTSEGYTGDTYCVECNEIIAYGEKINKLNHVSSSAVIENKINSTCAKAGTYDSVVYCLVCNKELSRTKYEIAKLTTHTPNNGVITQKATCGKNGVKTYSCTLCKATIKTETIKATGNHSYDKGKVTKAPTSTKTGVLTQTCTVCKAKKTTTLAKLPTIKFAKLTATKKGFKATWKKNSKVTGYQIRYSTSSKMSNAKTVTISKNSTTSKVVSKLKAKKKYYVQIRTYTTINGKKYYSTWSKAKVVTTKK